MNSRLTFMLVGLLLFGLMLETAWAFDHSHRLFDDVLKQAVVMDGPKSRVRYGWIKDNPEKLNRYQQEIEGVTRTEYDQWSTDQQKAFLINAYNALTIKLILSKYPDLDSIKDLGGFFSGPWKIKFFRLFGEEQHLDYIEHSVLRKDFTEPRIHFALVCASIGCPALRNEVFTADSLNEQLNDATKKFLTDKDRNYVDDRSDKMHLSSIFKWFKEDFAKKAGSVEAFVAPWITDDSQLQQKIRGGKMDITYLDYDWNLNRAE